MDIDDDLIPLSALNALLYCDRRAALRHLDGLYVHNEHTRLGEIGQVMESTEEAARRNVFEGLTKLREVYP